MTGEKRSRRAFVAAGILFILLQIGLYGFFGSQKQGYFIDEVFSYGLSNSYDKPFLSSNLLYNQWTDQSYFLDYVQVQPEHRFAYASVYINQENDVHPPLFYFLLHTICSFFPGTFSKWYGLFINAVCLTSVSLLLLRTGDGVFRDRWLAFIVCAAFVFNPITVSCFLFIRMYSMLLLLAATYFCLHSRHYQKPPKIMTPVLLSVNVFLGFMTHYYFLVLAFAVAAAYAPLLLIKKRWKDAAFYCLSLCAGIAAGCLFFPKCIYHIFSGYRGTEAFGLWKTFWSASASSEQASDFFRSGLLGKLLLLAAAVLILAFFIRYWIRRKKYRELNAYFHITPTSELIISFTIAMALYIGIISVIAPYDVTRYYFCLFGYGFILSAYFVIKILTRWIKNKAVVKTLVAILFAVASALTFLSESIEYLYPEQGGYSRIIEPYRDSSCIYVIGPSSGTWHIHEEAMRLSQFGGVYFVEPANLERRMQALAKKQELSGQCVMYINLDDYSNVNLDTILESSGYAKYAYLYMTEYSCVVLFE